MRTTSYDGLSRGPDLFSNERLDELRTPARVVQDSDMDIEVNDLLLADWSIDEELTAPVVPPQADEFCCSRCFLIRHRSQCTGTGVGPEVCCECA